METPLEDLLVARSAAIQLQSATDYRAYRQNATKQLARVRRALKIQVRPSKANKSTWKPTAVTAEDIEQDSSYAKVLVLSAERAWSKAMEIKAMLDSQKGGGSRNQRVYVESKLAKAAKYAREVARGISDESSFLSGNAKLELLTYRYLIEGSLYFEKQSWKKAASAYIAARVGLSVLGTELMKDTVAEVVDPALTFAIVKSGVQRTADIGTLARQTVAESSEHSQIAAVIRQIDSGALEVDSGEKSPSERLGPVSWRGHSAQVADPDLANAIIEAQKLEGVTDYTNINAFDSVLRAWQDALDMIKESIEKLESSDSAASHGQSSQEMYIIFTFISYCMLFRRIQRDLLIVSKVGVGAKPAKTTVKKIEQNRDVIRIYDTLLQSVGELLNLPGVSQDDELAGALSTLEKYFKTLRTVSVAQSYASTGDRKKALALYLLANSYDLESNPSVSLFPVAAVSPEDITKCKESLVKETSRAHGLAVLEEQEKSAGSLRIAVVDQLNQLPPLTSSSEVLSRLVDFDPKLVPAPVKPAFFDVAFNYIQYDEEAKREVLEATQPPPAQQQRQEQEQKNKKGFLGLWR